MLQIVASLTDSSVGVIYDRNIFMLQATETILSQIVIPPMKVIKATWYKTTLLFLS
jgi:hypothetical protein